MKRFGIFESDHPSVIMFISIIILHGGQERITNLYSGQFFEPVGIN